MYKHTQVGYVTISVGAAVVAAIILKAWFQGWGAFDWKLHLLVGGGILVIVAIFSSLTVQVTKTHLLWRFSVPLVRNSIALSEIVSTSVVRNPLYYGLGMHMISRGWIYNVSGLSAVDIELRDGTRVRLGTDEPFALSAAIKDGTAATV